MSTPVVLAVTAAFCFAAGNNLQRHAAARVPREGYGAVRLVARLLRSRRWLAGGLFAIVGLVLQVSALPAGGVILVQSVIASTLVFALVIEAMAERRRPSARQLGGSALVVGGLVVLIRLGQPEVGPSQALPWLAAPAWAAVGVVGGGALLWARRRPDGRRTAMFLGAAGGACFALDAVFLRDVAESLSPLEPARAVVGAAGFALASVLGNLAIQRGFQLAPLRHVLPAMASSEPMAAICCGWLIFGERLRSGPAGPVAVVVGLALMISGVVVCALPPASASATRDPGDGDGVGTPRQCPR